jgi:hypothetical protein
VKFIKQAIFAIRHGSWYAGFASEKEWPSKPKLCVVTAYYDGYHFAVHLWRFYIGVHY